MFVISGLESQLSIAETCSFSASSQVTSSAHTVTSAAGNTARLFHGECLTTLSGLPDGSVDLIAADLPYGVTQNSWDSVIPLGLLWPELRRVVKRNGAIVLTATQPFTSLLVASNPKEFKYDLVWEKTISSGQLNVRNQPMRAHETVLVFYRQRPVYNEQLVPGTPYQIKRKATYEGPGYGHQRESEKVNDGFRHARSVLKVSNPRVKGGHPTQKPVELMAWLIKTYSNKNDVVLDCCMGSGTTGVAAIEQGRNFIGIEIEGKYFQKAAERIAKCIPLEINPS